MDISTDNIKERLFYEFKHGTEWIRIINVDTKKIIKLKLDTFDEVISYSLNNGVLYVSPIKGIVFHNEKPHYAFYWYMFQHLKTLKRVNFIANNIFYSVPFRNFVDMSHISDIGMSLSKKLYIPVLQLANFIVPNN